MKTVVKSLSLVVSLSLSLFACNREISSGDLKTNQATETDGKPPLLTASGTDRRQRLGAVAEISGQRRYQKKLSDFKKRSGLGDAGYTSNVLASGRLVDMFDVWVPSGNRNERVTYFIHSFLNDQSLQTGTVDSLKSSFVSEVWRYANHTWCPIVSNLSVHLLKATLRTLAVKPDGSVYARFLTGSDDAYLGQISFIDRKPLASACEQSDFAPIANDSFYSSSQIARGAKGPVTVLSSTPLYKRDESGRLSPSVDQNGFPERMLLVGTAASCRGKINAVDEPTGCAGGQIDWGAAAIGIYSEDFDVTALSPPYPSSLYGVQQLSVDLYQDARGSSVESMHGIFVRMEADSTQIDARLSIAFETAGLPPLRTKPGTLLHVIQPYNRIQETNDARILETVNFPSYMSPTQNGQIAALQDQGSSIKRSFYVDDDSMAISYLMEPKRPSSPLSISTMGVHSVFCEFGTWCTFGLDIGPWLGPYIDKYQHFQVIGYEDTQDSKVNFIDGSAWDLPYGKFESDPSGSSNSRLMLQLKRAVNDKLSPDLQIIGGDLDFMLPDSLEEFALHHYESDALLMTESEATNGQFVAGGSNSPKKTRDLFFHIGRKNARIPVEQYVLRDRRFEDQDWATIPLTAEIVPSNFYSLGYVSGLEYECHPKDQQWSPIDIGRDCKQRRKFEGAVPFFSTYGIPIHQPALYSQLCNGCDLKSMNGRRVYYIVARVTDSSPFAHPDGSQNAKGGLIVCALDAKSDDRPGGGPISISDLNFNRCSQSASAASGGLGYAVFTARDVISDSTKNYLTTPVALHVSRDPRGNMIANYIAANGAVYSHSLSNLVDRPWTQIAMGRSATCQKTMTQVASTVTSYKFPPPKTSTSPARPSGSWGWFALSLAMELIQEAIFEESPPAGLAFETAWTAVDKAHEFEDSRNDPDANSNFQPVISAKSNDPSAAPTPNPDSTSTFMIDPDQQMVADCSVGN